MNIPCYKKCVVFITPFETCVEFNSGRDRKVPVDVIKRMYMNWCPPDYAEGFDEIGFVYNYGDEVNRMKYTYTLVFHFSFRVATSIAKDVSIKKHGISMAAKSGHLKLKNNSFNLLTNHTSKESQFSAANR